MKNVSDTVFAVPRLRNGSSRGRPIDGAKRNAAGAVRARRGPDDAATWSIDGIGTCPAASRSQLPPVTPHEIDRLQAALSHITAGGHPRSFKLLESGTRKIAKKLIEEAAEVAPEAVKHRPDGIVRESADLIYHLVVLWRRAGIDPEHVWREMRDRAESLG